MSNDRPRFKKKDFRVKFLLAQSTPEVLHLVESEFEVVPDVSASNWIEHVDHPDAHRLLIIDSDDPAVYEESLQRRIRASGTRLMYITVNKEAHYEADIVLNQNILALSQQYSAGAHTSLLLGPQYFVFREPFRLPIRPYEQQSIYSMLIAFGGADPHNLSSLALEVLADDAYHVVEHIHVVCGSLNPHLEEIKTLAESSKPGRISLHVDTPHMLEIMEDCDAALISLGLTFWETVVRGLPSLVIASSPREKTQFDLLQEAKYFHPVGSYADDDLVERIKDSLRVILKGDRKSFRELRELQKIVNPNGVENVIDKIADVMSSVT